MKLLLILSGLVSAGNLYLGVRFLLNVLGLLQTTKYGPGATAAFAILFLLLGGGGLYAAIWMGHVRIALLLSAGPWALALIGLVISALIGYYG
ncbi:MAG: hypothetical protein NW241_03485 [Bacteroidia bacterium]|nr:hypothetical protein [Bacteroidia bacterium]